MKKDVLVKHAYGHVYDAFWGSGWLEWSRFLVKKGKIIFIKGKSLESGDDKLLLENINNGS